jgi:hypothetical protein
VLRYTGRGSARTGRSWGLVGASYGVIGWFPVIVTRMFRCRRPCHAFVRHLANPISHSTPSNPSLSRYYILVASRAIAHQVEHFLPFDSFETSTHPSIHQSTHSSHIIPFLPPIRPQPLRTSSTYCTCHLPLTNHIHARGAASCQPKHPLDRNPIALVIYTGRCRVWRATSRDTPPS